MGIDTVETLRLMVEAELRLIWCFRILCGTRPSLARYAHTLLCVLHACVIPPPVCLCLDWSSGEFYRLFPFLPCCRVIFQLDKHLGRKKIKLATWQS